MHWIRGNREALQGFREIEDRYIGWVRKGLESGNLARAARMLERVRGLNPEREEVFELEQMLEAERRRKEATREAEAERKRKEAAAIAERERQAAEEAERERQAAKEAEQERQAAEEAERARKEAEEAELARQVGKKFRDCAECPEMVVIPSGSFWMGSPSSEPGAG